MMRRVFTLLEMIKWQHTVFALPMALAGAAMAVSESPEQTPLWWITRVALIVLACVFARTAAMTYNRWADRDIDASNPRTANRPSVTGEITPTFMLSFTLLCCAGFVIVAALLNTLALALSPVALAVLLGYSHAKRFTALAHLWLGAALGLSPIGAWVAILGSLSWPPVILGAAVMLWVGGFDLLYALADIEHDRAEGLYSIPAMLGPGWARGLSAMFHTGTITLLVALGHTLSAGTVYHGAVAFGALLLVSEHAMVALRGLQSLPHAFLTLNALFSLAFLVGVVLDVLILR